MDIKHTKERPNFSDQEPLLKYIIGVSTNCEFHKVTILSVRVKRKTSYHHVLLFRTFA